jgi:hypothetical protein
MGDDNTTRNASMVKVMAALIILAKEPPEEFDPEKPMLKAALHYREHSNDCLATYATKSGKPINWGSNQARSAPETATAAWAYHYYVRQTIHTHSGSGPCHCIFQILHVQVSVQPCV